MSTRPYVTFGGLRLRRQRNKAHHAMGRRLMYKVNAPSNASIEEWRQWEAWIRAGIAAVEYNFDILMNAALEHERKVKRDKRNRHKSPRGA